jgi:hypothetical protein
MRLEVNIEKKYFFGLLALGLIVLGIVGVIAYGTNNPQNFGHSVGEIDWNGIVQGQVKSSGGFCIGEDDCINSWESIAGSGGGSSTPSGVTKIIAGNGIGMSSTNDNGAGDVIIISKWTTGANNKIYYNDENVGIGVSDPSYKLHVNGETNFEGHLRLANQSVYKVVNRWCQESVGTITLSSTCHSKIWFLARYPPYLYIRYYDCNGVQQETQYNPADCNNQLI